MSAAMLSTLQCHFSKRFLKDSLKECSKIESATSLTRVYSRIASLSVKSLA